MESCNPMYMPGVGKELSLHRPEEKLLNEEDKERFQVMAGSVMHLGHMTRYDIL